MKITVVGLGYVGLSISTLLAQNNEVVAIDIIEDKVKSINNRISPIQDEDIEFFLKTKNLNLRATTNFSDAYSNSEFIIIATPTNYDDINNKFDTTSVEKAIKTAFKYNKEATIVIKSTIPVGYTRQVSKYYCTDRIIFSPEFLREGRALYDNLFPSRIIVGEKSERANKFASLLVQGAKKESIDILFTNSTEAEAIKLFSNTYLALRVAYFNELDTYCEIKDLNAKQIIDGMGLDPRIGNYYNNPSFGYGGYCLPKDTKQLKANYQGIPNDIINAIVASNVTRKRHIVDMVLKKKPNIVGIYRLTMKSLSDNFRSSAIQDIMLMLKNKNIEVIIYEPKIKGTIFENFSVVNSLERFKNMSDLIIANRMNKDLYEIKERVYTRDLYDRD